MAMEPIPPSPLRRLSAWGALLASGYRHLHRGTRLLLVGSFKLAVVLYFLFCVLFLGLRYAVLPNIEHYKSDIEQIATRAVGQPVSVGTIQASWHGLRPHFALTDVVLHDAQGRAALRLPAVAATVSWWSAVVADVRLHDLEITNPELDIRRSREGKLYVAGIYIDPLEKGNGAGASWVLSQRQIVIRHGRVRWNDEQRAAPELILENVNSVLHNRWRRHRFALQATPAAALAAPLDIRADFLHAPFARAIADPAHWYGELYLDLRQVDLAGWKPYIDAPLDPFLEVSSGSGTVRAWLQFDHANVVDLTADLALANASARFQKELPPLNLLYLNGRVSVREAYEPARTLERISFGRQGHTVALSNVSLQTEDGIYLPATTLRETFAVATSKQAAQTRVEVQKLDLKALAALAARLPLSPAQRQLLQTYGPRGQLQDFSAQWRGAWSDFSTYAVKGRFTGLGLDSQAGKPAAAANKKTAATPGFDNLTGSIDATEKGGVLKLDSQQLSFYLPGYLHEPQLPLEQLKLQAHWTFPTNNILSLQLDQLDLEQDGVKAAFSGKYQKPLHPAPQQPAAPGTIDLTGKISRFDFKQIRHFLPAATPEHLRDWLLGALQQGQATDVALAVKGDLAQFPFRPEHAGGKPTGIFTVAGKIENGSLNYAPDHFGKDGKAPEWPLLEQVNGSFLFDRSRMEIKGKSAKTRNVALSDVTAQIPDLLTEQLMLNIDGSAGGALQDFVGFVNDSPVLGWIGDFTEETRASGTAKLALKLQMPLDRLHDTKVQGTLQLAANDVTLQNGIPPISKASGKLEFHERGFSLNGIKGEFLGGPTVLSGGGRSDGATLVKVEGSLTAEGVRKNYSAPALQRPLQRISGSARYATSITFKEHHLGISVASDLIGLGLDFPAPLHKAPAQAMPLKFDLATVPSDDVLIARDEIRLALGSAIAAQYQRRKALEKQSAWRLVAGGIGINVPAPEPESGLLANVSLETLDIDAWRNIAGSIMSAEPQKQPAVPDPLDVDIAQYIEPDTLAARAGTLIVMGKKLDRVVVGASHQDNAWQANIDSAQASGYVTWNESSSSHALGRVKARLSSLIIPQSAATDVTELLEGKDEATQIPALDIVAERFELFGKQFGRLELAANNIRPAAGSDVREWRIGKLALTNPDAEFKGAGKWTTGSGKSVSNLTYALDIADAGKLLERFGFAHVLRGGKGRMDGEVSWNGLPFSIDIPSLSGQLHLDLQSGQFLKVDPGAAKLLGVLSLQSLPRRLTLDFRDVFSEGFAFDGVVGTANIAKGLATTDNLKMRSVSATVLMDGSADLVRESQDLHVAVIPEINVGAASVLYALAINPVIGIGSFLAQLFLRDPLMRAFTFEYEITGPWADPKVVKLSRNHGLASATSEPAPVPALPSPPVSPAR
jgi:uncharacterized protein (TIGR02099 family)